MIDEEVMAFAKDRSALHEGHASCRQLSENYDEVGMAGELAFGKMFGLMPDLELRPEGDKGVDFRLILGLSVDVKTARKAYNLIHEVGKPFADLYVLCQYDDETRSATILGWETGFTLRQAPQRDFGYGVVNHYIPADRLRPISELRKKVLA